ncbi:hypothetical protein PMIT1342_02048 [Prochlorococcus marinus str. MIT 1342]|nr:hypothetical protein PMIT1342_02048 [Prochlorococcus marinus str. MIT 1342]
MHEGKTRAVSSTTQLLQPTALQLLLSHQNEPEAPNKLLVALHKITI